jgi:Ca2+/H+ antiporter, TMEM165/GDT1 family
MRKRWVAFAPLILLGFLAFVAVGGAAVQLLWNWLLPSLVGARQITFWQALGVLALSRILFGGFGGRHGRPGFRGGRRGCGHWERLTPEEREHLGHLRHPGAGVSSAATPI